MNSTRLPGKPLLKIGDRTLIERCVGQAARAGLDPWVATDSVEIAKAIDVPERCIMTGEYASGTDRVAAAAEIIDPEGEHEFIINYQGDMPFLDPKLLKYFVVVRQACSEDILTATCDQEIVAMTEDREMNAGRRTMRLHIGLYGFKREALRKFATLPQGKYEISERLEQMRAPNKFSWGYADFPSMPIEINTQADLDRARSCLM